jgi:hypothetical protein
MTKFFRHDSLFGASLLVFAMTGLATAAPADKTVNSHHRIRPDAFTAPRHGGHAHEACGLSAALAGGHVRHAEARLSRLHTDRGDISGLDFFGDGLLNIAVSDANGGSIVLTPAAADKALFAAINTGGVTEAKSLVSRNGEITLAATTPRGPDPTTLTNVEFDAPGRPIMSYADAIIARTAPVDTLPYFNPLNPLTAGTNMSIKWNPDVGHLPQASNKMTAISPQAGKAIASTLTNIEPAAGGTGGQGGPSTLDCLNNFLAEHPCAP